MFLKGIIRIRIVVIPVDVIFYNGVAMLTILTGIQIDTESFFKM